ncbi:hypothetical protein CBP31_01565 [Oceanisphaera profunda]|uniref:Multidrug resistance protein MdtA-like barrel-sandwich hybrid domain-containing protein n=1 Tax=Oceanisphaera profunda TaxID=1416627 RepID=A0A1Y0D1T0_9GAMM|nr:efflux RND transporter periplasmic adaptor subunit [Oceanisphaera profunda]ART81482.1 hypothetical protein CBP31_01565 [Oceanisphaera profunda]
MVATRATLWLARYKKLSWLILVLMLLAFWLWRGELYQAQSQAPDEQRALQQTTAKLFFVEASDFKAEPYQAEVLLQGKLAPIHSVNLRAQVSGTVLTRPELGQRVAKNDALITVSDDGRRVQLEQAQADLALRQAQVSAGARLRAKQHISETDYLSLKAAAVSAKAAVANAKLAVSHSEIVAPFAGQVDSLPVEQGGFVQVGDELLTLVDVSRLKLTAHVPQQAVLKLNTGLPVRAVLLDGRELNGKLDFIAQAADDQTRSFALEAKLDNPHGWRVAGASVGLHIQLPKQDAIRLSPALLALNKQSQLGVYLLDEQDRMQWQQVTLLSITTEQAWVSGLPSSVRLVTRGADFVAAGTVVNVRMAESALPEAKPIETKPTEIKPAETIPLEQSGEPALSEFKPAEPRP